MNLQHNKIPDSVKKIHLIAVCGTGMGALACMLKDVGFDVSGSDQKVYPPMSEFLAAKGVRILNGFKEEHLASDLDVVIVGNAVSKDNPEVKQMIQMELPFCSMPQAVNRFFADGKKAILVSGTHGKTTTASILAWMLHSAGYDPSFLIGGILKNFNSNYHLGSGEFIVIEGDEYDTAFFDKGPKFLHYPPYVSILTSVEFDHADIFRDLAHVKQAFGTFLDGLPSGSKLLAFDNDNNIGELIHDLPVGIEKYGSRPGSDWQIDNISIASPLTSFEVLRRGLSFKEFKTPMVGLHNLHNALACIAAADHLGVPVEAVAAGLQSFEGIKRRQEIRGSKRGITIMDDFAHHPTAVRETVMAVKAANPDRRLIAVFEPRTNSSMRKVFQDVYPQSFGGADLICIRQPPLLNKVPATDRFSSEKLVDDLKMHGQEAHFFPDTQTIIDFLAAETSPGDLVLIMSNGGFDNIHQKLLESL